MPQSHDVSVYDGQPQKHYISPHCDIVTGILGLLFGPVGMFSIFRSTNKPSITRPEMKQRQPSILIIHKLANTEQHLAAASYLIKHNDLLKQTCDAHITIHIW